VPSDKETVEIINVEVITPCTVTVAEDDLVGSAMEVADTVTVTPLAGGLAGAV
jgi:hypothetical protein